MKPRTLGSTGVRSPESAGTPSLLRSAWEFAVHRMVWSEVLPTTGKPRGALRANGLRLSPKRVDQFAKVTRGSVTRGAAGRILPPTIPSVWEGAYLFDLLRIADLPFPAGIIHLGSERIIVRPLEENEDARLDLAILKAWSWRGGTRLQLGSTTCNTAGHLCAEGEIHMMLHGIELDLPEYEREKDAPPVPRATSAWEDLAEWKMPEGLGLSYARVSGDINPIHLSRPTARWFGFPGAVAHGACTEAMIAHELIRGRAGGDAAALRRLLTRFTAPIVLPVEVVLQVHDRAGDTGSSFRLLDASSRDTVYAAGEWV